jgi:hypothetical protein
VEDRASLPAVLRVADSMLATAMVARVTSACAELAAVVDGQTAAHGESQVSSDHFVMASACRACRTIGGHGTAGTQQIVKCLPAQGIFSTTIGFEGEDGYIFQPDQVAVLGVLQHDVVGAAARVAAACPRLAECGGVSALYEEKPDTLGVHSILSMSPELAATLVGSTSYV